MIKRNSLKFLAWTLSLVGSSLGKPSFVGTTVLPWNHDSTSIRVPSIRIRGGDDSGGFEHNSSNSSVVADSITSSTTTMTAATLAATSNNLTIASDYVTLESSLTDHEDVLIPAEYIADTKLPTDIGQFRLRAYRIRRGTNEHLGTEPCVIYAASEENKFQGTDNALRYNVPVRIHDQCVTSEVFGSRRCDCKDQLIMGMKYIQEHGGVIIYLQQEGRGIGIANKVAAYALQDTGLDTVDANLHLGFPDDCRQYGVVPSILHELGIGSIQLLTNNPRKVERLTMLGVSVAGTVPMVIPESNPFNQKYMKTKLDRMGHANFASLFSKNTNMMSKRARSAKHTPSPST